MFVCKEWNWNNDEDAIVQNLVARAIRRPGFMHPRHTIDGLLLTPWSRVLLEKLTGSQPRNSPHYMEPEGSLPHSQVSRSLWLVRNMILFLRWGVVSTSSNPQAVGPPLVGCPRLLIQFIRGCSPYWRPFLHPQPEDAPCRGDRDPLIDVNILALCFTAV